MSAHDLPATARALSVVVAIALVATALAPVIFAAARDRGLISAAPSLGPKYPALASDPEWPPESKPVSIPKSPPCTGGLLCAMTLRRRDYALILRIGARGSKALAGPDHPSSAPLWLPGWGSRPKTIEIVPITTSAATASKTGGLIEAGGKGLFTKELDEALHEGRIDLAVAFAERPPDGTCRTASPSRACRSAKIRAMRS